MDSIVDAGASTRMLPQGIAKGYQLEAGSGSKYTTASNNEVVSQGKKSVVCRFQNGEEGLTTWEVGRIHRPLAAVSKMVKTGHAVWFDSEENGGSGIYSYKTGKTKKIYERNGVYVLPAWVKPNKGFHRHA